jgi:hypothetical protein
LEHGETDLVCDPGRVAEAKLIKKYKGLRFFDDDEDTGGYFKIRSDRFTWKGKRSGGWVAVCDKMPDEDPAHDPDGDADIEDADELVEYLINEALHDMIKETRQAPGIILIVEGDE